MKKLIYLFVLSASLVLIFSCKKEENKSIAKENQFSFNNQKYSIDISETYYVDSSFHIILGSVMNNSEINIIIENVKTVEMPSNTYFANDDNVIFAISINGNINHNLMNIEGYIKITNNNSNYEVEINIYDKNNTITAYCNKIHFIDYSNHIIINNKYYTLSKLNTKIDSIDNIADLEFMINDTNKFYKSLNIHIYNYLEKGKYYNIVSSDERIDFISYLIKNNNESIKITSGYLMCDSIEPFVDNYEIKFKSNIIIIDGFYREKY